jgi:hypothetical protein
LAYQIDVERDLIENHEVLEDNFVDVEEEDAIDMKEKKKKKKKKRKRR